MLPAAPVVAVPLSFDYTAAAARESNGSCSEGDDIFMTMETECNDPGFDFLAVQRPKTALVEKESLQREKQITVDPISVKGSTIRQASFRLVSPPLNTKQKSSGGPNLPLPLPPLKLKFVSASLPNSAASSPLKKIWKNQQNDASTRPASKLSRQQSATDGSQLELQGSITRRRSKSMGEGRLTTASDDFDLWLEKPSAGGSRFNDKQKSRSFPKQEVKEGRSKRGENREIPEDGFKCGKLCLFLPTRGKGKPVRPSPSISSSSQKTEAAPVISRTVSLEKFECGSWSPSALINEDGESANLFFDLPLELIRCSVSDMQSPVTAAFVFDKETKLEKRIERSSEKWIGEHKRRQQISGFR
ncbi:hypothetical protein Nepgr_022668 [Nepenthes gracilis]|uniref:Uncharacterized protein n=1 Tax=Nepenthes gracilis TaxID=150966 RepID=A0AAD3T308_NEPGR|nr:hypothetical protein Nepgr_022668 [Nepenthes gracilis]